MDCDQAGIAGYRGDGELMAPEVGQLLFGNPMGEFEMPPYACSMLHGLLQQFDRIYWNEHQREWNRDAHVMLGSVYFRPYYWGDDDAESDLPNFGITGDPVGIRWYKHPGRGQTANVELTPRQWAAWHDRVYRALSQHEYERWSMRSPGTMLNPDTVYTWCTEEGTD